MFAHYIHALLLIYQD